MLRLTLALASVCLFCACGSNAVSLGTVNGVSMTAKDVVSNTYITQDSSSGATYHVATTIIGGFDNVCADLKNNSPSGNAIVVVVADPNAAVAPGTYVSENFQQGNGTAVIFAVEGKFYAATSASITLTSIGSDGAIAGSFDATFTDGHFAGAFDATSCSSVQESVFGPI